MKRFYHATHATNVKSILRKGLLTNYSGKCFNYKSMFGSCWDQKFIFLAESYEGACEHLAVLPLGDSDRRRVAILEIDLPDDWPLTAGEKIGGWHCYGLATMNNIPPECIRVVSVGTYRTILRPFPDHLLTKSATPPDAK